jgi:SAM-dependent methyltransferase
MARRLHRKAVTTGRIAVPAVPSMIEEYVEMCNALFSAIGVFFNEGELAHLRRVMAGELETAFAASPRSMIVITYESPLGAVVNYHIKAEWHSLETEYEKWFATREPPFFGTEPDARVWNLAMATSEPEQFPILDLGAGTGRNSLPLARRGHPVDAVELTGKFADIIRLDAQKENLKLRVFQHDIFDRSLELRQDYQLIILSEVATDFRSIEQLRNIFTFASKSLVSGGCLVLSTFLAKDGFELDDATRQLGQQFYSTVFARMEVSTAIQGLPLSLISDESVYEYEKNNLPAAAWPPTSWYEEWVSGQDVFDLQREQSPIELRWLVYQRIF